MLDAAKITRKISIWGTAIKDTTSPRLDAKIMAVKKSSTDLEIMIV